MKSQLENISNWFGRLSASIIRSFWLYFHISFWIPSFSASLPLDFPLFALFVSPFCSANEHVTAIQCTGRRRRADAEIHRYRYRYNYVESVVACCCCSKLANAAVVVAFIQLDRLRDGTGSRTSGTNGSDRTTSDEPCIHPSIYTARPTQQASLYVCASVCIFPRPSFLSAVSACHFDTFICFGQAGQAGLEKPGVGAKAISVRPWFCCSLNFFAAVCVFESTIFGENLFSFLFLSLFFVFSVSFAKFASVETFLIVTQSNISILNMFS